MLSLSADAAKTTIDVQVVNGRGDGDLPLGKELRDFAQAIATRNPHELVTARNALLAAGGNDVVVDAAAVAANFQRMVRIADGTGIPVDPFVQSLSGNLQDVLDLRRFESSRNTPPGSLLTRLLTPLTRFVVKHVMGAKR